MITREMTQMLVETAAMYKLKSETFFQEAKPTLKKIVLTEEYLDKLIFEVTILANRQMYFILKDGELVHHGIVGFVEGALQTIQHDIEEKDTFINASILMSLGDVDKLHTFLSSGNNLTLCRIQAVK
ncbi:hypothetical protein JMA_38730 (plasmid) [Jeotgalibacillus malaysiensis]|uniref:Uncharacterized protein n=1 Tax=Jeotgalibacillus malaysiensis TaxID=1508404 RepID=A0A0B5ASU5_9BACL|nr:hypothetical protein [Jeotgalibacillus malaysiensis]AJD93191.1 hypothetical protein JMA_38730 [Jeotgalibacillus malaysiensis]